jgi:hypothetical protein
VIGGNDGAIAISGVSRSRQAEGSNAMLGSAAGAEGGRGRGIGMLWAAARLQEAAIRAMAQTNFMGFLRARLRLRNIAGTAPCGCYCQQMQAFATLVERSLITSSESDLFHDLIGAERD